MKTHATAKAITCDVSPYDPSTPPAKASATFSVSFVEFSDGSTYGSSKWGRSLPDARRLTSRYIQQGTSAKTLAYRAAQRELSWGPSSKGVPKRCHREDAGKKH